MVALAHVTANTHKLLETHPKETLEMLAALAREKRLGEMDIVWKQRFQTWVEKALGDWEHTEENVSVFRVDDRA